MIFLQQYLAGPGLAQMAGIGRIQDSKFSKQWWQRERQEN